MQREVLPDNYRFVTRRDRPGRSHGGVAIIAKPDNDASEIDTNSITEFAAAAFPRFIS